MGKQIINLSCKKCGTSFDIEYEVPTSISEAVSHMANARCPNCGEGKGNFEVVKAGVKDENISG